ncbi:rhomboid family intramembrane serine protease [Akkermansiaceae bacterium]|nr:rhomboid family intramembrane serine protease [Akkermansiaceae bacterium]MDA7935588.1 rhomboid family intramembrane serine protease [Akkermansiaceae bacterium]MDB4411932.1 rhomboid family intramembrane serine protease [Akkermansiaceae bacterium]MDB4418952.1 rhomboid family intramembrane serine protease [bacterium]MDB4456706.1 rhomboid family intramembrane serine protease [bacterium]
MIKVEQVKRILEEIKPQKRGVMLVRPGVNLPTLGCLLLLAIHAGITLTGGTHLPSESLRPLYETIALSWSGIKEGRVSALLIHGLFHGDWLHVATNAFLFFYTTARLGHVLRPAKILVLFTICSVGAGLAYVLSQAIIPTLSSDPLVGASGGVMGMFLAQTVIYPDSRMLFLPASGRNIGRGFLVASLLLFLMTPSLGIPMFSDLGRWMVEGFGERLFKIGHLYHFAAGLMGVTTIGYLLPRLVTLEELQSERMKREHGLTPTR